MARLYLSLFPSEFRVANISTELPYRSSIAWVNFAHGAYLANAINPRLLDRLSFQQLIDLRLREIGRANEARTTFNHLHSVVAMVEAGYGAAVMPAFVQGACSRYAVQVSVMTAPEVPLDFYALSRKGTHTTEAARAFLAAFTAQLREYPQLQP